MGQFSKVIKPIVRPVSDPLMRRIEQRVNKAVARALVRRDKQIRQLQDRSKAHGQRLSNQRRDIDAATKYVPSIMNTISSQHAALREVRRTEVAYEAKTAAFDEVAERVSRAEQQLVYLEKRMEFIRTEMLYEHRYGGAPVKEGPVEPKVINAGKVKDASSVRLNIGCGHITRDDYLNVDMRAIEGIDIVAEVGNLPFAANEVDEIFSSHVLEHFPEEALKREFLPYWFGLLKPGGEFRAIVPDAVAMIDHYKAGDVSFANLRLITYGGQEYEGDFHFTMFSPEHMGDLLAEAGFVDFQVEASDRINGDCYEMEVVAKKPGA